MTLYYTTQVWIFTIRRLKDWFFNVQLKFNSLLFYSRKLYYATQGLTLRCTTYSIQGYTTIRLKDRLFNIQLKFNYLLCHLRILYYTNQGMACRLYYGTEIWLHTIRLKDWLFTIRLNDWLPRFYFSCYHHSKYTKYPTLKQLIYYA